jgi:hypothetical protein
MKGRLLKGKELKDFRKKVKDLINKGKIYGMCCFCGRAIKEKPMTVVFSNGDKFGWQQFFCHKKCIGKNMHKKASCELREELR